MRDGERMRVIQCLEEAVKPDGKHREYWTILRDSINKQIEKENGYLERFKSIGISEKNAKDYNETIVRIGVLKEILKINETLIRSHKSMMEKVEDKAKEWYEAGKSFVSAIIG